MSPRIPDLVCTKCGSNRFNFPNTATGTVKCHDCGTSVASLEELPDKIVRLAKRKESRDQRLARHAREVAESHEQLRASVAETDRLIVASNAMISRHRREDQEAGD